LSKTNGESWGPYPLIFVGAVVGVALIFLVDPRWGGFALGAAVMVAAALRFAGYGGLAVRSKKTDVITLGLFGFFLVLTSLILENDDLKRMILSLLAR
jgi:drug/metabolite transporter (DMT)-like permease